MKRPASSGRAQKPLSSSSFLAKHADLVERLFGIQDRKSSSVLKKLAGGELPPKSRFTVAVDQLEEAGFSRILKAAEQDNSPEAFKRTLAILLSLMDVRPPEGVFTPTRGRPGRRPEEHTLAILTRWEKLGRPPTRNNVCMEIAKFVFPELASVRKTSRVWKKCIALVRSAIHRPKPRSDGQIRISKTIP